MTKTKNNHMAVHSTYEVRWQNFKGFKDTGWIKIKPITILIGANNAGKTSFITPLLLMNQTLSSRDSTSPLIVKGNLYDGGNLEEIIHNYESDNDIFLGLKYHVHTIDRKLKKVGAYPPGAIDIIIGKNKLSDDRRKKATVLKQTIFDMYLREYLSIEKNANDEYEITGFDLTDNEKDIIRHVEPLNFLFSPNTFLYEAEKYRELHRTVAGSKTEEVSNKETLSRGYQELLKAIAANYSQARNMILDMSYLGPIRDTPHRHYEISDEIFETVGLKGENTAYLLKQNIAKKRKEINRWVKKFGFGDELVLNKLYKEILYSISFKNENSKIETNIANTGFGASQVLPLIVQALVSQKESITIAEQPEIHLNPRLQGVLAELFAYMATKDQRIIVETHSEHLLLKLRTLVASKELDPNLIALYYIEKKDGISTIEEIPIDDKGRIKSSEWPIGFFDDTLKQSMALATAQAKFKSVTTSTKNIK